jgi:hypothetical protein
VQPSDTTAEAAAVQRQVFAAMTGPQRLLASSAMAEEVRTIVLAGLRTRHPDASDDEIHRQWLRLLHGEHVADARLPISE